MTSSPSGDVLTRVLFFLHILTAIVGFGSTFVWAMLGSQAKDFEPKAALLLSQKIAKASKILTSPFIYATGATGLLLVILGRDYGVEFKQTWVSAAMFIFIVGLAVSLGLQGPNQKAMLALQERLVDGTATPPAGGGPPAEVAELAERGQKAAMYGGILHLLFALILLDMVFKPGLG